MSYFGQNDNEKSKTIRLLRVQRASVGKLIKSFWSPKMQFARTTFVEIAWKEDVETENSVRANGTVTIACTTSASVVKNTFEAILRELEKLGLESFEGAPPAETMMPRTITPTTVPREQTNDLQTDEEIDEEAHLLHNRFGSTQTALPSRAVRQNCARQNPWHNVSPLVRSAPSQDAADSQSEKPIFSGSSLTRQNNNIEFWWQ